MKQVIAITSILVLSWFLYGSLADSHSSSAQSDKNSVLVPLPESEVTPPPSSLPPFP